MNFLKHELPPFYSTHPWKVTEEKFSLKHNLLSETIFSLSNGYLGIRGSFEEVLFHYPGRSIRGTYINGFYESVPIPHAERGYGYAMNTQTMLNVTDSSIIELFIEGERFTLDSGTIINFQRNLDMKKGYLNREVIWRSPDGREVMIGIKRLVSFMHRHLIVYRYRVKPLNFSGDITISSSVDGDVDNHTHEEYDPRYSSALGDLRMRVRGIEVKERGAVINQYTVRSQLEMVCAVENCISGGKILAAETKRPNDRKATTTFRLMVEEGEDVTLEKYAAYYTSRDYPAEKLAGLAWEMVSNAREMGMGDLFASQEKYCRRFWENLGLKVEGDPEVEQGLHFNLFHLLQASGSRGQTGIGAKGLTSEGYDGHYFWDMEIYMLPFFSAVNPGQARHLLEYRYSILDYARKRARELSHEKGALYPWRTIAGEEGSSYFPAGTAQYHINAAIAYAIWKYVDITGDYSLMLEFGAEILFETARLWEDLGTYVPRKNNQFGYNEVTGPDEYSALVNNNCYTNLMSQWHLHYAAETALHLKKNHPEDYRRIAEKIDLSEGEIRLWQQAAETMFIPYDESMLIHPQDDGFLDKQVWDFASTPAEKYPLLLHYHPLVIYRFQVCKQPDVILAHLLLDNHFSIEQKRRDYNYYEPITTHDSSLSPSIFSIVASEVGYKEDAYGYFHISARLDLDDLMKGTHNGVHLANMAGSWLCLVNGFAGMRIRNGKPCFHPYLPERLSGYSFRIHAGDALLQVSVNGEGVTYELVKGKSISFTHFGDKIILSNGEKVTCGLREDLQGS
ncbi:MAG: glycosyl hydrolase family 65 protein [Bacillota bacterium]|nr:glycosyl hydrolase family 65 protein [Bacillota bacterium]